MPPDSNPPAAKGNIARALARVPFCPVCGSKRIEYTPVLWPELVTAWELDEAETEQVNLQQGLVCGECLCSLRVMTLATALMRLVGYRGIFADCVVQSFRLRALRVLELNTAGGLETFLRQLPHHRLAEYPEVDMQAMAAFGDGEWDLVLHSDTLEHVPDPEKALRECHRVLAPGGALAYTVPAVQGRVTRRRHDLAPTFHGLPGENLGDRRVVSEYGSDAWKECADAGFTEIAHHSILYPESVALVARKEPLSLPRRFTGERLEPELGTETPVAMEHLHRYAIVQRLSRGRRVLDIASGEGYGSHLLARNGAASVLGVDICGDAVRRAEAKYPLPNLAFKQGSCLEIPAPDDDFDVVVSYETIEHIEDHGAFLREVRRVLKPGGLLCVSSPNKEVYGKDTDGHNPFHLREITADELEALLREVFGKVRILGQRFMAGSLILGREGQGPTGVFHGDYGGAAFHPGLREAMYSLALASDAELPALEEGLFAGPGDFPDKLRVSLTEALDGSVLDGIRAKIDALRAKLNDEKAKNARLKAKLAESANGKAKARGRGTPAAVSEALSPLEAEAVAAVREIERLRREADTGVPSGPFRALSSRYRKQRRRKRRLREWTDKLAGLRSRLADTVRGPDYVPRPSGSPPGIFPREREEPVTVILPVYDAYDAFRSCLAAAVRHTPSKHRILVLDDAGTDARVGELARSVAAKHSNVRYHRHAENLGYTRNTNFGLLSARGDVVLLNSDTRVTKGWLAALRETAHSAEDIATVTALSNASGAFSVPENHRMNALPAHLGVTDMAALLKEAGSGKTTTVPTGNGFCFYLRRDAITAIGCFDAQHFPVGYGEENDFCQRAILAGWKNVVDPRVFVHHRNSSSFGDRKAELMAQGAAELNRLHPIYERAVGEWLKNDPLDAVRAELGERVAKLSDERGAARDRTDPRPAILLVVFDGGGGVPLTNRDLAGKLRNGRRVLVLTMAADEWTLSEVAEQGESILDRAYFPSVTGIGDELPREHDETLRGWITGFGVRLVHFRHWLGSAPELVAAAKAAGAGVVVSLHDFYSVCPSLNLIDASGACCYGDCQAHAEAIAPLGDCEAVESWPGQAAGVTLWRSYVHAWRDRVRSGLAHADALVASTESVRAIIARTLPEIAPRITVIEHGRDLARPDGGSMAGFLPARFVFLGEATFVKGADFVIDLARLANERGLSWEFHLLGKSYIEIPELPNLRSHGSYERDALAPEIKAIAPTLILLPSRAPETYCHALSEAWSCGVPVLAHRIGALDERVTRHGGGWLEDTLDAGAWLARLADILADEPAWQRRREAAAAAPIRPVGDMGRDFVTLYDSVSPRD